MPGFDLSEFFLRLLVCFVTGNSDMHLKNFSLIEKEPGSRRFVLSAAYDLLPVNVIMPEDKEETALTLNGKKSGIKRDDFNALAENAGINLKAAGRMIDSVAANADRAAAMCMGSELNDVLKERLAALIKERSRLLTRRR